MEAFYDKVTTLSKRKKYYPLGQWARRSSLSQKKLLCASFDEYSHHDHTPNAIWKKYVGPRLRDMSVQVHGSLLAIMKARKNRVSRQLKSPLARLQREILLPILGRLDMVSFISLKVTSKRFFLLVHIKPKDLKACAKCIITCQLEKDLIARGLPLPKSLACAFCKEKYPREDFGFDKLGMEYGFEWMIIEKTLDPIIRYYWRNFPKIICYSPKSRDCQQEEWARALLQDRWLLTREPIYYHCGERLIQDDITKQRRCPACPKECVVCG